MMPIGGYETEFLKEEAIRQERLHTRVIKKQVDRLRRALRMEISRGEELSLAHKDKFIMTPLEFISKSYTKISLANLYRRYRQIRIQALTECLAIVGQGGQREENKDAIRAKIHELGTAHKASAKRLESKKK